MTPDAQKHVYWRLASAETLEGLREAWANLGDGPKRDPKVQALKDRLKRGLEGPRRSNAQNNWIWPHLRAIEQQVTWHGQQYRKEDWKDFFMHSLKGARGMPGEGGAFIPIGFHTSGLTRDEMSELQEIIAAFCEKHGVRVDE